MASSNKRERDLARARFEAQQRRRAQEHASRRRRQQIVGVVATLVVLVAGIGWFVVSNRTSGADTASAGSSPSATSGACQAPVTATTKTASWKAAPAQSLTAGSTYRIALQTNCGTVVIESTPKLAAAAPKTVNSQVFLTQQKFFDASDCFRLTTSGLFVLQCGSPTNDGKGGPGYTIPDENLPKAGTGNYPAGTVAMANSGPNTNGSQFFLVYKTTTLPADYTIWGTVASGLDVLTAVAADGVADGSGDGKPLQPLVITKATVSTT